MKCALVIKYGDNHPAMKTSTLHFPTTCDCIINVLNLILSIINDNCVLQSKRFMPSHDDLYDGCSIFCLHVNKIKLGKITTLISY